MKLNHLFLICSLFAHSINAKEFSTIVPPDKDTIIVENMGDGKLYTEYSYTSVSPFVFYSTSSSSERNDAWNQNVLPDTGKYENIVLRMGKNPSFLLFLKELEDFLHVSLGTRFIRKLKAMGCNGYLSVILDMNGYIAHVIVGFSNPEISNYIRCRDMYRLLRGLQIQKHYSIPQEYGKYLGYTIPIRL